MWCEQSANKADKVAGEGNLCPDGAPSLEARRRRGPNGDLSFRLYQGDNLFSWGPVLTATLSDGVEKTHRSHPRTLSHAYKCVGKESGVCQWRSSTQVIEAATNLYISRPMEGSAALCVWWPQVVRSLQGQGRWPCSGGWRMCYFIWPSLVSTCPPPQLKTALWR